jgi:hypothetical protein
MAQSCVSLAGEIGDSSCIGIQACVSLSGTVGDDSCWTTQSCVGFNGTLGNCERNPVCDVDFSKVADPDAIPSSGATSVHYSLRIEFSGDVQLNSITDDRYMLNPITECESFSPTGQSAGAPSLPQTFSDGWSVVCDYELVPPPGGVGDEFVNTATINIGSSNCVTSASLTPIDELPGIAELDLEPLTLGPAACIITDDASATDVTPNPDGTIDITTEASVRYVAERRERSVPNIGAGLSGLFNGMPTPLPTAPSAAAATTSPVIRPPNTGDGGVLDDSARVVDRGLVIGAVAVLAFTGIAVARRRRA